MQHYAKRRSLKKKLWHSPPRDDRGKPIVPADVKRLQTLLQAQQAATAVQTTGGIPAELANLPSEPVKPPPMPEFTPARSGLRGSLNEHGGRAVTAGVSVVNAAQAVVDYQRGDMQAARQHAGVAAMNAATAGGFELVQSRRVQAAAIRTTEHAAAALAEHAAEHAVARGAVLGIRAVGGKIPLVGAVVGVGFGLYDIGSEGWELAHGRSNWKRMASTTASAVVGTVGGAIGFGAGEAAQEVVHYGTKAAFGERDAARHSATVELASTVVGLATSSAPVHGSFAGRAGGMHLNQELKNLEGQMAKTNWGQFIGNGDTQVTVAEIRATMQKFKISVAEMDANHDGHISGRELTNSLQAHKVNKPGGPAGR